MSTITKEGLIENGGSLWEKGSIERVYLDSDTAIKSFNLSAYKDYKDFRLGKNKLWFNCKTNSLHSDKGTIRSMLNGVGFKCGK